MNRCNTCRCNKVCDHNKYGFETCGNYIPDWISVEDGPPKESGKYLVCGKNKSVYQTKYYTYPESSGGHWGQKDNGKSITHWMPLPEAPKEVL